MPQPGPQTEAIRKHWIDELLFGGAVGGGKSDYLLGDFGQDVPNYGSAWRGILFRKTYGELEELITRSREIYPGWFPGCEFKESKATWTWPNGATLKLRYMEHSGDWGRYWGHQYTWIGWDELGNWSSLDAYNRMKARLRSAHDIPNKRIRASGNPGGAGHQAVKSYFQIDAYPMGGRVIRDPLSGSRRMFIRSRLSDNKILLHNDPRYADRLHGMGSPQLVRAWLDGDWAVVAGAFFPEYSTPRHVVAPFAIPSEWTRIRAMDWGSAKPFSVGWYAIADGSPIETGGRPLVLPRGCLAKYREWYGCADSATAPNVGLKLTAEEVADGISEREAGDKIAYGVLDPAAFARDGGPSIAERMAARKVFFNKADNARVARAGAMGGWDMLRSRLKGTEDGPMLVFFSTCKDTIRTLPAMQHDATRPEDMDTDGEDHAADETRYACMSRPWIAPLPPVPEKVRHVPTFAEAIERHMASRRDETEN